jgi:hypothetical protein
MPQAAGGRRALPRPRRRAAKRADRHLLRVNGRQGLDLLRARSTQGGGRAQRA